MAIYLAQAINDVNAPLSLALGDRSVVVVYRQIMEFSLGVLAVITLVAVVYGLVTFVKARKHMSEAGGAASKADTSARLLWVSRIFRWVAVCLAYVAGYLAQNNVPPQGATVLYNTRETEITFGFFLFIAAVILYGVGMFFRQRLYLTSLQQAQTNAGSLLPALVRKQYFFNLFLSGCLQFLNILVIWFVFNLKTQY